ncbi:MAG: 3-oxoacid CoA-transferase subunit A [Rhodospirillaceae bacterium]
MIDKTVPALADAVADIKDGMTVAISGFGAAGSPVELVHALIDRGARELTVINNNAGNGEVGLAALIREGLVAKMICSFPRSAGSVVFADLYRAGKLALEVVPQGTLAERLRAAGAGIPAFYTPTSVGTPLAEGKETREFNGKIYVMEPWLPADVALIKADVADRHGNLTFNMTARNFAPVMAMAATTTIAQAREVIDAGGIDPAHVVTPGIFVDRVVHVPNPEHEDDLLQAGRRYP